MKDTLRLLFLGVRGSVPVSGPNFLEYGGGTCACLIRAGDAQLLLDAGSGLGRYDEFCAGSDSPLTLLLTHAHVDHLLGLPLFSPLYDGRPVDIYGAPRAGLDVRRQLETLMRPPLWPIGPEVFSPGVRFHDLPQGDFPVGPILVEHMEGSHPGGCTVFAFSAGGGRAVFALDYESGPVDEALADFAQGCQILICDGHYAAAEYEAHRGFGHSTPDQALALARRCNAQALIISHHGPHRTDSILAADEARLRSLQPRLAFAKDGMEVTL